MGRSPSYAIPEFLSGNLYLPVNVVQSDREVPQHPVTDGNHTSDSLLIAILHSRSMTHGSFLEIGKAILHLGKLKAEGQISPADAERASVLLLAILRFRELKARGRISSTEDERASIPLLRSCMKV